MGMKWWKEPTKTRKQRDKIYRAMSKECIVSCLREYYNENCKPDYILVYDEDDPLDFKLVKKPTTCYVLDGEYCNTFGNKENTMKKNPWSSIIEKSFIAAKTTDRRKASVMKAPDEVYYKTKKEPPVKYVLIADWLGNELSRISKISFDSLKLWKYVVDYNGMYFVTDSELLYDKFKEQTMSENISITCTVNGKEVPLSSLSDETIKKIKESEVEPFRGFNSLPYWVKDFIKKNTPEFYLDRIFTYDGDKLYCEVFPGESDLFFKLTSWLEQLRKSRPVGYSWYLIGVKDNQIIISFKN